MTAITLKTPVLDRLTDDEFFQFCADHRDLRIERNAQHQLVIRPPTNSETGASDNELGRQLANWNINNNLGLTFDPSAGFTLPTGAMLSPDANWIARPRWEALAADSSPPASPCAPCRASTSS